MPFTLATYRELAMHVSKSGIHFLLCFVGLAEVLGLEYLRLQETFSNLQINSPFTTVA